MHHSPLPDELDLTANSADFPRRYFPNGDGHRVIVGLTQAETSEFETLDRHHADPLHRVAASGRPTTGIRRWLELYAKHATAWDDWMRNSQVDRENDRLPAF
jgi:hypothetical protein